MEREASLQGISQKPHPWGSPVKVPSLMVPIVESLAERCPITWALLHSSIKVLGILAPPHIPGSPPVLLDPQNGAPNRAPTKRDAPFPEPTNYLFPVNGLPRFPKTGPYRERHPSPELSSTPFPTESPVNEPPSMFPNRVPKEREASSPQPMVYSFIYICQSPQ